MNKFVKGMQEIANETTTENGAFAVKSTNDSIVDLFASIGGMRRYSEDRILSIFSKAYADDKLLALKTLFYARDIRGGLGERETFKTIMKYLARTDKETIKKLIKYIPEYGRWDDLYCFVGTPLENAAFKLMKEVFEEDLVNAYYYREITLLAKWLKSPNTSSKESRKLGRLTAKYFKLSTHEYQQALSVLRKYLNVVERKMSDKEFEKIDFSKIPSLAHHKYQRAFKRNVPSQYDEYLKKVKEGKSTIKTGTLYPYDIIRPFYRDDSPISETDALQWKNLPNYVSGENDYLVMPDVSESMWNNNYTPISTSVGLAIYFAERNKGAYHNVALQFASQPAFITLKDDMPLEAKIREFRNSRNGYSTNIAAAFQLILDNAIKNKLKNEELPKSLIIISDMQFDPFSYSFGGKPANEDFYTVMKEKFEKNGYDLPNIVFWNVGATDSTFHLTVDKVTRAQCVSGFSASTFKFVIDTLDKSPYEAVLSILNNERYDKITL